MRRLSARASSDRHGLNDQAEAEERVLKNREFRESLRAAQEAAKVRNAKEAAERRYERVAPH